MRGLLALALIAAVAVSCGADDSPPGPETVTADAAPSGAASPGAAVPSIAATESVPDVSFERGEVLVSTAAGDRTIPVEFAITAEQFGRGLGFREELAADAGMLFVMEATRVPNFWMKGMRFPLDFVWIDEKRRVASVTANVPHEPGVEDNDLMRYSPDSPVRYVLELNAGAAERLGIVPGAQVSFEVPGG